MGEIHILIYLFIVISCFGSCQSATIGFQQRPESTVLDPGLRITPVRAVVDVRMRDHDLTLLAHNSRRRDGGVGPVEDDGHLLQGVAARLGVGKVDGDEQQREHHDEDDVVLPVDRLEGDGVHEGVDEDGHHGRAPRHGQAAGAEAELPDLTGVCGQEGGSFWIVGQLVQSMCLYLGGGRTRLTWQCRSQQRR